MRSLYTLSSVFWVLFTATAMRAQAPLSLSQFSGNFQLDAQYYKPDSIIGAPNVPEKMLMNGFGNFNYTNGKFSAGLRYESYLNPLQGFDPRYKGSGIMYRYLGFQSDNLQVTLGSFYEQFGSGIILRAYEERNLGYDNAFEGIRVRYQPVKGFYMKGLVGKQRSFFTYGPGIVRGIDGELQLNELLKQMTNSKTQLIVGSSFVSKFQSDQDPTLVLPENVGTWSARVQLNRGSFSSSAEFASKINDPSADNGFIYKNGNALFLNAAYATKGLGITLSGKRVDNMSFRSDRSASVNNLQINYLPVLNKQHTYTLLAFYPYASQLNGEMAFSSELVYALSSKTDITVNYSGVNSIDKHLLNDTVTLIGYSSDAFKIGGETYSREIYVEANTRFNKKVKGLFAYAYQAYNKDVIQGLSGYKTVYAHIGVADVTWRVTKKHTARIELEHMYTKQDYKSWAMGLVELKASSKWFVAIMDLYNYANSEPKKRIHYFSFSAGYTKNAHRISFTYGKQRAGIMCVGGVCRNIPASNGISLNITSSF